MSRQLPDPERCPPPPRGRAPGWFVVVLLLALVRSPAALALESLSSFPHSQLSIQTQAGMQHFDIWVADTAQRSEQGLMFVHSLPPASGMLFPLERPGAMRMWMKNTLIPLDMLFVDERGRVVYIRERATPQSQDIISAPVPVKAVLELAGGECARLGIRVGDQVRHRLFGSAPEGPVRN